jgi:hypothetical protein
VNYACCFGEECHDPDHAPHTMINRVQCHLVTKIISSEGVIDWFDRKQLPVKRGEFMQPVISGEKTGSAHKDALRGWKRRSTSG